MLETRYLILRNSDPIIIINCNEKIAIEYKNKERWKHYDICDRSIQMQYDDLYHWKHKQIPYYEIEDKNE